jgi:acyl-coenzyme A synthetase/AMP-(fatty) acid ligase
MSVRSTIESQFKQVAIEQERALALVRRSEARPIGLDSAPDAIGLPICVTAQAPLLTPDVSRRGSQTTEWILLTSGTTGAPKLVLHDLATLTAAHACARGVSSGA